MPGTQTFLYTVWLQVSCLSTFKESIKQGDFFEAWKIIAGYRIAGGSKNSWQ